MTTVVDLRDGKTFEGAKILTKEEAKSLNLELESTSNRRDRGDTGDLSGFGPGLLLSSLIFKITGQSAKTCGRCGARIQTMNQWGWWKCWENRKIIIAWLITEAARRGIKIDNQSATSLFRSAWRELRQNRRPPHRPCRPLANPMN